MADKPEPLGDADWMAARLGERRAQIYKLVAQGLLPGVVRVGRKIKFEKSAVEGWIRAGGQGLGSGTAEGR